MVVTNGSYRVVSWMWLRFFDLVGDQGQEPLAHDEADKSFLEDLRDVINSSPLH